MHSNRLCNFHFSECSYIVSVFINLNLACTDFGRQCTERGWLTSNKHLRYRDRRSLYREPDLLQLALTFLPKPENCILKLRTPSYFIEGHGILLLGRGINWVVEPMRFC